MTDEVRLYGDSERAYLEIEGEEALKRARSLLNDIDAPEGAKYVRIIVEQEKVEDVSITEVLSSNGNVTEEIEGKDEIEPVEIAKTQRDTILQTLNRKPDEFWHTPEVRDHLPEGHGIPETALSKRLWALSDEGYLDKQDSEKSKRMKRYKLTSKGIERATAE